MEVLLFGNAECLVTQSAIIDSRMRGLSLSRAEAFCTVVLWVRDVRQKRMSSYTANSYLIPRSSLGGSSRFCFLSRSTCGDRVICKGHPQRLVFCTGAKVPFFSPHP